MKIKADDLFKIAGLYQIEGLNVNPNFWFRLYI